MRKKKINLIFLKRIAVPLFAFLISILGSYITGHAILYLLNNFSQKKVPTLIAVLTLVLTLIAVLKGTNLVIIRYRIRKLSQGFFTTGWDALLREYRHRPPPAWESFLDVLPALLGVLCAVWALAAILIYLLIAPNYFKNGIQVCVFLISVSIATLFFINNRDKLPTLADKVTYFSGVCLGPVATIEIFI